MKLYFLLILIAYLKKSLIYVSLLLALILLVVPLQIATAEAGEFTNSIGMKFKTISPGDFYMGSCAKDESNAQKVQDEENKRLQFLGMPPKTIGKCLSGTIDPRANSNELPQHHVRISKAFQMGMHEVTLGQFKKFVLEAGRNDLINDAFIEINVFGDSAPVVMVSWKDAQEFARWLNKKEGENRYRLPTEAEWEYAARAGTTTFYPWGNNDKCGDYGWCHDNAHKQPRHSGYPELHSVGTKKPNPFGLYDMFGNASEWVADWYDAAYYAKKIEVDPVGPETGSKRVCRGGTSEAGSIFTKGAEKNRAAFRDNHEPNAKLTDNGFRLVRQLSGDLLEPPGAPAAYKSPYHDNGDNTILDSRTGLVWMQSDDHKERAYREGETYCSELVLAGQTDWRLPTVSELKFIIDVSNSPSINPIFSCMKERYWAQGEKIVSFAVNTSFYNGRDKFFVRCVRGGK